MLIAAACGDADVFGPARPGPERTPTCGKRPVANIVSIGRDPSGKVVFVETGLFRQSPIAALTLPPAAGAGETLL